MHRSVALQELRLGQTQPGKGEAVIERMDFINMTRAVPKGGAVTIIGWPPCLILYRLLTDRGSLIGGGIALIADILAYVGATEVAASQIAAMMRRRTT